MSTKIEPVASQSVTYGYDLQGHQISALFTSTNLGITNSYDGFGRRLTTTNTMGPASLQISHQYDLDGDLTRVTHPDGSYFQYTYDGDDRFTGILENGATSIVSQSYLPNGLRSTQSRGAVVTSYSYQPNTLLASITDPLTGTGQVTTTFAYNPANQLTSRMRTNDAYAFTGTPIGSAGYLVNGLNQYTSVGGTGFSYNGRGNLTSDGSTTYSYDAENHLTTASGAHNATLTYDPLGRLYQIVGASTTQFLYDGDALVAEYNSSGALQQRYVHGPQVDEPLIWYQGGAVSSATRRSLQVDHQGSIVSLADASANALTINTYDEYGAPAAANAGRFQYTGQAWLSELGLYYYKARVYEPHLGRFLQTDPVGYQDDLNLYAYVGNDPVDRTDPTGQWCFFGLFGTTCSSPPPATPATSGAAVASPDVASQSALPSNMENRGNRGNQGQGERGTTSSPENPTKKAKPKRDAAGNITGWTVPTPDGKGKDKSLEWGLQNGLDPNDPKWSKGSRGGSTPPSGSTPPTGSAPPTGSTPSASSIAQGVLAVGAIGCALAEPCGAAAAAALGIVAAAAN
jgi:RHS repeat-associated protein